MITIRQNAAPSEMMAFNTRADDQPSDDDAPAARLTPAEAFERLVEISAAADVTVADAVEAALEVGLAVLDLDFAELGRSGSDGFRAIQAARREGAAPLRSAPPGWREAAAAAALAAGGTLAVADAAQAPPAGLPADAPRALAASTFDAGDGDPAFALFAAAAPRQAAFAPDEIRFLDLLGRWIGGQFARHRRLRSLAEHRAELAMIVENVSSFIASLDPAGRVRAINHQARGAIRPADSIARDRSIATAGQPLAGEVERWEDEDGGTRYMRVDRVPYEGPNGDGARVLVVATDITELVAKEQALEKANAGLNQFAYIASHDLQEPLRKIGTFTDLLVQGLDRGDREDVDYALRVIRESARRASALIHDLLTWSRLTNRVLERGPVILADIVRETVADVLAARPDLEVDVIDQMSGAAVLADASQLRQLAENLVTNAVKYRDADRRLRIELRFERRARGAACFEIVDNGIGFDPAYAHVIFEPFRRLHGDRQYAGTGVGLAICSRVCERHGWTISGHGRPGFGATFRVEMPPRSTI